METTRLLAGRREWGVVIILCLLACLPLLWPFLPPLSDLPAHVARFAIIANADDPFLAQFYTFEPKLISNLGVDLPVQWLAPLIGVEAATKWIVFLIPSALVLGILRTSIALHGRLSPFAILGCALAYSVPFHMGFVNYWLGIALMWNAVATWLTIKSRVWSALFLAIAGFVIWVAHAVAWGLFVTIVAGLSLGRRSFSPRHLIAAGMTTVPALILPLAAQLMWITSRGGLGIGGWFKVVPKVSALIRVFQYEDRTAGLVLFALFLVAAALLVFRTRPTLHRGMAIAAGLVLIVFLLMPETVLDSAYADTRIAALFWMTLLVAVAPRQARPADLFGALAIVGVTFVAWIFVYADMSARQRGALSVANPIAAHSRVASLNVRRCNDGFSPDPLEHVFSLLLGRKHVFFPYWRQDVGNVTLHYPAGGRFAEMGSTVTFPESCAREGESADDWVATLPREAFDYAIIRGPGAGELRHPADFRLLKQDRDVRLYALR